MLVPYMSFFCGRSYLPRFIFFSLPFLEYVVPLVVWSIFDALVA